MTRAPLPLPLVVLGLAGVAPQVACLAALALYPDSRWFALAAGCCYAAIILSFLGGLWWSATLLGGIRTWPGYASAVVPSLIGWGALLPWCVGWTWPGPSLVGLGLCLLLSPLVDRVIFAGVDWPPHWLRLRVAMAVGIGSATLALAAV